ncbi:glycosyltransferase [Hyphococcus sp.]|uniref:glycosyltransferase n=1 Tax=Hyphococcus sp. TaxID=2038636 RepID=UPI0035C74AE3
MRVAVVQYGVFHDRYAALKAGEPETYYAQAYSVNFIAELAERCEFLGVIGVLGEEPGETAVSDRLRSACVPAINGAPDAPAIIALLKKWRPDRLILQAPDRVILRWALRNKVDTLPLLADSFEQKSLRRQIQSFLLGRLLNRPAFRAVGNHNVPSCLSLKRIGVDAKKIYPWDWPHELRPEKHPVKALPAGPAKLVYVGSLASSKGVGDCIEAARILREDGVELEMTLVGGGGFTEEATSLIDRYGLSDTVRLAGKLSHDKVIETLKSATLSMAPSWHIYPEGLPMTIYEALATRTPLALSDHPMFQLYFKDAPAARMAPERNPEALAAAIKTLITDEKAYAAASEATGALWNKVKCDLTWGMLIKAWLGEDNMNLDNIKNESLAARLERLG